MPLFVHPGIWSTSAPLGPGQIWYPLQGLSCPSPRLPRLQVKGSFPVAGATPSSKYPPRAAQSEPTLELSTLSGDDIYDVEMVCYLFSAQRMWRRFIVVPHTPLSPSLSIYFFSPLQLFSPPSHLIPLL